MAQHTNVPRDILESMRENVDRRVKLSIKRLVNFETKKDKVEQRVLAFSTYRLFIFTAKNPTKVETNFHYLNIKAIESKKPNQLVITTNSRSYTFTSLDTDTDEINHMITHIGVSLKAIFPAYPIDRLIKKIDVTPPERLHLMQDMMKGIARKETGPCGGFTVMYACMCDFHSLAYRDEVAWDVDTIYLSQDNRELCLKDFDHLKERDLVPIVSALVHNTWFTSLNANNVRLTPDVCTEVLRVMKKNCVMEALLLSNTGITSEFVKKLSTLSMADTLLEKLDLSNNLIDDIGAEHLFGTLSSRGKPVSFLDMSGTKVTTKGLNKVAEIMARSSHVFSGLQTLKLAGLTSGKMEDLQNLYTFLATPNMITRLDLSGTDVELDKLLPTLQRGCGQNLTQLVLAKTVLTYKKSRDTVIPPSFKQFFASVCSLKHLDLSGTRLPPEALKDMLLGMVCSRHLKDVHLDISGQDLQSSGAQNLQNCLSSIKCISSLNISNIGFQDNDLCAVLKSIGQNKAVRQLNIGRVFGNVKLKNLKSVLEELVSIIQDDDSVIESLSLADSKLKDSMNMIINALGSNTSLTEIDISGNLMGDLGARMLSKALQINNKLKTIVWDKNNTTWQGFEDIASALEKNYTVKKMPMPINDASVALKTQPEKTEHALQTIERLLQRNHSPQKYSSDQAYRLQQGFLISSTQQMVDRLVVQTQDTINALTIDTADAFTEDINMANAVIKAADNSKTLLPCLHDIAIQSQKGGNVQQKLKEISAQLKTVLESQMKTTVDEMLAATRKQCEALMEDQDFVTGLLSGCSEKSALPKDFTSNILDGVDTDIFNTLSGLNLAVAAHVSDRVIDEVMERLSVSHKTLTNFLNEKKKGVIRRSHVSTQKTLDDEANQKLKGTESPSSTPHIHTKRKSMHTRKIRPESVIDGLDDNGTGPNLPLKSPSDPLVDNFDVVPELKEGVKPLTNVTKSRPQRKKNVRPTTRQSELPGTTGDKVDENIAGFFTTARTIPIVNGSQGPETSSKPNSTKTTPDVRRKKSAGGLFGFGKQKNEEKVPKKKGLFKSPGSSKNKNPQVQEEPAAESPKSQKSGSKTSLASSLEEEVKTKNNLPQSKSSSLNNSNNSLTDSTKNSGSENDVILTEKPEEKVQAEITEKKPLPIPKFKKPIVMEDSVKKPEDEDNGSDKDSLKSGTKVGEEEKSGTKVGEEDEEEEDRVKSEEVKDKEKEEGSGDKDDTKMDKEKESPEEEKKDEAADEPPKPVLRKPAGLGFGVNIMAEIKAKQEKRLSQMPVIPKPTEKSSPSEEKSSPFNIGLKPTKPLPKPADTDKDSTQGKPQVALRSSDKDKNTQLKLKQINTDNPEAGKAVIPKNSNPDKLSASAEKNSALKSSQKDEETKHALKPSELKKSDKKDSPPTKKAVFAKHGKELEDSGKQSETKTTPLSQAVLRAKTKARDNVSSGESTDNRSSVAENDVDTDSRQDSSNDSDASKKSAGLNKPAPPRRPKPALGGKPTPAPRRSFTSDKDTPDDDSSDVKMEEKPEMIDSGIVYDSDTLKLSVKEKIAKLGRGDELPPTVMKKSDSLPRNSKAISEKDAEETPKRPKSMFSLLEGRPELQPNFKSGAINKGDGKPMIDDKPKPDIKPDDKPDGKSATEEEDDVILV